MNNAVTLKEILSFICELMDYCTHNFNSDCTTVVMVDQGVVVPQIHDGSLIQRFITSY